jgi:hypothetical protein
MVTRPTGSTPVVDAVASLVRCAARAHVLLLQGRLRQPIENRGRRLAFADGTTGVVYRETRLDRVRPSDPAVLLVGFRLRLVTSARAHRLFRAESLLNTVLFVGFPGFVSKLWLSDDENGRYRGVYQWDDPELAERYVGALRRVLDLVSEPGSVTHRIIPGVVRDDVLRRPSALTGDPDTPMAADWWRLVDVQPPLAPDEDPVAVLA